MLGATGNIGQRFIQLLKDYPDSEIQGHYASDRSEGKTLKQVLRIKDYPFKEETLERRSNSWTSRPSRRSAGSPSLDCRRMWPRTASRAWPTNGVAVFSNAASHRMRDDVPLLIPEVNSEHIKLVKDQNPFKNGGYIVTNANCSTTGLAIPMSAIYEEYGLRFLCVSTYQAVSGPAIRGPVPGHPWQRRSIHQGRGGEDGGGDIQDAGRISPKGGIKNAVFDMVASCARVPVVDGHMESAAMIMGKSPTVEEINTLLSEFRAEPQRLDSRPPQTADHRQNEDDRPQPVADVMPENRKGQWAWR